MDDKSPSGSEAVRFKVKPNAFLYALEATRIYFVILAGMSVVLVLFLHLMSGVAMGFLMLLASMIDCMLFPIFFVLVLLRAFTTVFIITNKRVIVEGVAIRRVSIPIESIEGIEVRSYGTEYGSVYLEWDRAWLQSGRPQPTLLNRPRSPASLTITPGRASIWLSVPLGSPPMIGFYGFRGFDSFAELIAESRAIA